VGATICWGDTIDGSGQILDGLKRFLRRSGVFFTYMPMQGELRRNVRSLYG